MKQDKTTIALIGMLMLMIATAGCTAGTGETSKSLAEKSGIDTTGVQPGTSFKMEMKATEKNQQNLVQAEPIPKMENSLERENLIRRYKTLNDRDKVFHVYLMSYGKVVSYFTAKGKVSSVNSKLTQPEQLVKCEGDSYNKDCIVSSPQLDGSYGSNGDAVFFYTTDGAYVEWNGNYVVSERPLNIKTPVSLTKEVEN